MMSPARAAAGRCSGIPVPGGEHPVEAPRRHVFTLDRPVDASAFPAVDVSVPVGEEMADLIGPALARDAVTAIVNAGDRVIDCTVTN
jgi:hypothetical protein